MCLNLNIRMTRIFLVHFDWLETTVEELEVISFPDLS